MGTLVKLIKRTIRNIHHIPKNKMDFKNGWQQTLWNFAFFFWVSAQSNFWIGAPALVAAGGSAAAMSIISLISIPLLVLVQFFETNNMCGKSSQWMNVVASVCMLVTVCIWASLTGHNTWQFGFSWVGVVCHLVYVIFSFLGKSD